jgi:SAM-dependent methyltransferase
MSATRSCRFCKSSNLVPYLDLGSHPPSDRFLRPEQLDEPETYYPLKVMLCRACGLSQLSYTVPPEILYQEEYPYESPQSGSGLKHYHDFAAQTVKRFELGKKDLVVDIGSNIGTLLGGFKKSGTRVLGIDPAENIAKIARKRGIPTLAEFFSPAVAKAARKRYGAAKAITGTNVFAHVGDHASFMQGLKDLLAPGGIFIFESPHMLTLMKNLEYDTVYAEHLLYLSLKPVVQLVKKFGFEVFRVEEYSIHGGSFRVFIARKGERKVEPSVAKLLKKERVAGIHSLPPLLKFAKKVAAHRSALLALLDGLKKKGKRIAIVSTPAKGMTLLNYCKIGTERIDFATERTGGLKCGRYTPGGHIPIMPDGELLKKMPDYALLLAWNFADDIMKNLSAYKKKGGKFIIPIPWPKVV